MSGRPRGQESGRYLLATSVSKEDYERIRAHLGPQSISDWLRNIISLDLEDEGQAPLTMGKPGVWRKRTLKDGRVLVNPNA